MWKKRGKAGGKKLRKISHRMETRTMYKDKVTVKKRNILAKPIYETKMTVYFN